MRATTRRRIAVPAAVTSGLLVSGLLVWHTSNAAFSSSTANTPNTFRSGSVVLDGADSGGAMFTASGLKPNSTETACVVVNYKGSLPGSVALSAAYNGGDNALAPYLDFTIEEVSNGAESCTAATRTTEFLAAQTKLSGKVTALAAPGVALGWTPSGSATESKRYRFKYTLADDNAAQNKSASVAFTWTATNS